MNTHTTVKGYAALSRGAPLLPIEYSPGPLGAEQVEIAAAAGPQVKHLQVGQRAGLG
jgi:hypothetical protein